MKNLIIVIFMAFSTLFIPKAYAQEGQSEQDLFMQAFGEQVEDQTAQYRLSIDNEISIEVPVIISSNSYYLQDITVIKAKLAEVFKAEYLTFITNQKKISISQIRLNSINTEIDHSNLVIKITPTPKQRITNRDSLYSDKTFEVNTQSLWSVYTNHFYNYNTRVNKLNYHGDFAANYGYVTIDGNYSKSANENFYFDRTTLTKDWNKRMIRLQVGDINLSSSNLMIGHKGGGVKISKDNALRPGIRIRRVNEQNFFLKKAAWVKVSINEVNFVSKYYQAGEHSLANFNLPRGVSSVQLEIEYIDGEKETQNINQFFSNSLLRKDFFDFNINLFNKSMAIGNEYKNDLPYLFATNLSYGYSQNITINNDFSISDKYFFLGFGADIASRIGNFNFNIAKSAQKGLKINGWSSQLNWFFFNHSNVNSLFKGISIGTNYKSRGFSPQVASKPFALSQLSLDVSTQYRFNKNWSLDIGYSQNWRRKEKADKKLQIRVSKQWRNGLRGVLSASHTSQIDGSDNSLLLQIQYSPANKNYTVNSQIDNDLNFSTNTNLESESRLPGYNLDFNHSRYESTNDVSLSGNYDNQYLTSSSSLSWNDQTQQIESNNNLGHAISIVDGQIALSRPINGSFTIFKLENFEKDREIKMNADNNKGYDALISDKPIAIGNSTPYAGNYFELNSYDIKVGEEVTNKSSFVVPRYKSGNVIKIIKKTSFYVKMKLRHLEKPLSNAVVDVIDSSGNVAAQSFTDEQGEVFFEGLNNGTYKLDFGDYAPSQTISIKGEDYEVLNLGLINIK